MTHELRVIGAGLPRTGTMSLKLALETLTAERCHHMLEVLRDLDQATLWRSALAKGDVSGLDGVLSAYRCAVDLPAAYFWEELAELHPDALIVLSTRSSAQQWWRSASATVFQTADAPAKPGMEDWQAMFRGMLTRMLGPRWLEEDAAVRGYELHNERVRARVSAERLVEWSPEDGWVLLCKALDLPIPSEEFPRANSTVLWVERGYV